MTNETKMILATGIAEDRASRYDEVLSGLGFSVEVLPDPRFAVERLEEDEFDAVIAGYPLETGIVGGLIRSLTGRESQNYGAGLVLLAQPERLRAAASLVGRGVHKAVSIEEDPAVLGIIVQRLIEVSRPMLERLPLRLEVRAIFGDRSETWTTENISGSGMLIGSETPPPVGTRFEFELFLPDEIIEGQARVARSTMQGRELVDGFGVRFSRFRNDGQRRLLDYLRSNPEDGHDGG